MNDGYFSTYILWISLISFGIYYYSFKDKDKFSVRLLTIMFLILSYPYISPFLPFTNMNSNSNQPKNCSEAAIKKQVRAAYENLTYVNNIKFTKNLYQEGEWLYYYQATSETGNVYSGFATCDEKNIKVTTDIFN